MSSLTSPQEFVRHSRVVSKKKNFEFPDRNIISVGADRFRFVDKWFLPNFIGKGVRTLTSGEILYVHVMLPGGSTIFQWISKHMTQELSVLAPSLPDLQLNAPQE